MLKIGEKAPAFALQNQDGKKTALKDFKGKTLVLYFYPKDDTSGCTKEACDFRNLEKEYRQANAVILGVSADSLESHQKFRKKHALNFTLLSDTEKEMIKDYGVWKEKSMYGRKYMGIERTTLVIDAKGKIAAIYPKVKVTDHAKKVLQALKKPAED